MLGVRRLNKVQIDLWQGEINEFFVDLRLQFLEGTRKSNSDGPSLADIILDLLAKAGKTQCRHLSISADDILAVAQDSKTAPGDAIKAVRTFITKQGEGGSLQRITFVSSSLQIYDEFQKALFTVFPESLA